ncbi:MAG: dodecin family protein [Candidatus Aceula meridiana]|nr:dodecin family protein [Candidatus Aceula meridiana]
MLKMIEIVGVSPEGYSQAVKEGVDSLIKSGEKIHFFEVIQQRGSVRDGELKEYQAVIKVAVEA